MHCTSLHYVPVVLELYFSLEREQLSVECLEILHSFVTVTKQVIVKPKNKLLLM